MIFDRVPEVEHGRRSAARAAAGGHQWVNRRVGGSSGVKYIFFLNANGPPRTCGNRKVIRPLAVSVASASARFSRRLGRFRANFEFGAISTYRAVRIWLF